MISAFSSAYRIFFTGGMYFSSVRVWLEKVNTALFSPAASALFTVLSMIC